jgi:hypothetical protein
VELIAVGFERHPLERPEEIDSYVLPTKHHRRLADGPRELRRPHEGQHGGLVVVLGPVGLAEPSEHGLKHGRATVARRATAQLAKVPQVEDPQDLRSLDHPLSVPKCGRRIKHAACQRGAGDSVDHGPVRRGERGARVSPDPHARADGWARNHHIHEWSVVRPQTVESEGRQVRKKCILAVGEHRGDPVALAGQSAMADGVDTSVHAVQPARSRTPGHRLAAQPKP